MIANGMGMAVGAEFRVADVQFAALAVLGDGGRTQDGVQAVKVYDRTQDAASRM